MSSLWVMLMTAACVAAVYAGLTLRRAQRRLHYRDRPLFWRAVPAELSAAGLCLMSLALALALDHVLILSAAAVLGALAAVLAYRVDLNPREALRRSARRDRRRSDDA